MKLKSIRGFTTKEILVIIFIFGILAAIIIPLVFTDTPWEKTKKEILLKRM